MSWNKNNRAHACLYFFSGFAGIGDAEHHDQRDAQFTPTGEWDTDFLIKSAAGESPDTRAAKARAHAELLDGVFRSLYRARYEEGFDRDSAIQQMHGVLNDPARKLKDLADPVDAAYQFIGEI